MLVVLCCDPYIRFSFVPAYVDNKYPMVVILKKGKYNKGPMNFLYQSVTLPDPRNIHRMRY